MLNTAQLQQLKRTNVSTKTPRKPKSVLQRFGRA